MSLRAVIARKTPDMAKLLRTNSLPLLRLVYWQIRTMVSGSEHWEMGSSHPSYIIHILTATTTAISFSTL